MKSECECECCVSVVFSHNGSFLFVGCVLLWSFFNGVFSSVYTRTKTKQKTLYFVFFFCFVLCCVEYGIKCCQHGVVRIDC